MNATGGGQSNTADLNDPNTTVFPDGIVGNDSEKAFRLSGSYEMAWGISLAGSMISNNGYPYVSTYAVTRAARRDAGHRAGPRQPDRVRRANAATSVTPP